mmetsp:Transcript_11302/g.45771  ORF Transcript_11302/g.45771 Transcript_11302/m.45771 type:complete len:204 (+) Transcript_11302:872-1483(+)
MLSSRCSCCGGAGATVEFSGACTAMAEHVPRMMRFAYGARTVSTAATTTSCVASACATDDSPSGLPALRVVCEPANEPTAPRNVPDSSRARSAARVSMSCRVARPSTTTAPALSKVATISATTASSDVVDPGCTRMRGTSPSRHVVTNDDEQLPLPSDASPRALARQPRTTTTSQAMSLVRGRGSSMVSWDSSVEEPKRETAN